MSAVHYAPTFVHGRLRDGRSFAVATTRCRRVGAPGEHFNSGPEQRATCAECRANLGSLNVRLWCVHVLIDGKPLGRGA